MKSVRPPYKLINAGDMSANITSPSYDASQMDVVSIQVNYAGSSPVGALAVQGSLDNVNFTALYMTVNGTVANSFAIPASTTPILIDITPTALPFLRVVYTFTSGTGSLTALIAAKRTGE